MSTRHEPTLTQLDIRRSLKSLRALIERRRDGSEYHNTDHSLSNRCLDVFLRTYDLGFTAFGGPPVHFQIIHSRFVDGKGGSKWIDEQTYQELFAICQALPGPGSTKMLFCVTLLHAGFIPALMVFFVWSLPGALAMYGLSLGVQRINEILPSPVYALLSGLNASTVGIIALAAVQLAGKAITDKVTRLLVLLGACAGVCYSALWYFPVLLVIGGLITFSWDGFVKSLTIRYKSHRRRNPTTDTEATEIPLNDNVINQDRTTTVLPDGLQQRRVVGQDMSKTDSPQAETNPTSSPITVPSSDTHNENDHTVRLKVGIAILITFFTSFTAVLLTRGLLKPLPRVLAVFANMYLAGTIIFGGGPVVIPLLRTYVVDPGWVSSRDFLLGLAIIQAFPGPNFNFAVYLGALALQGTSVPTIIGSMIAFAGIFLPGISLAVAVQGFWKILRSKRWVVSTLRGVNATAVGLVFTAVYRLWEIGYLTPQASRGQSLGLEPWWVVVAVLTYAETAWFKVPPAIAIVIGAILGLCWYGVTNA